MRVLAVVTARGGSKGIPRKNIRLLGGKPLLQYTAEAALSAATISRSVLTTDDPEIAQVGRGCGLDVQFMRPAELALDTTPSLPVIQHAVRWLEEHGERFDAVCVLQPTSPFRRAADIDACVSLLSSTRADCVISVLPVPHEYNPHWVFEPRSDGLLRIVTGELVPVARRQELPPAFHRDGSVYVTLRDVLMNENSLYGARIAGYVMNPASHVNIDTPEDWARAEMLIESVVADNVRN